VRLPLAALLVSLSLAACRPLVLLIGGVRSPAQAPTATPFDLEELTEQSQGFLKIGEGVEGGLSEEAPEQWWLLPLEYGDTIFIASNATTDSAVAPQLYLIGPEGTLVAQAQNPAADRNALIPSFCALQEGAYYLRVRSLMSGTGAYAVRVGRLAATPTGQPSPSPSPPPASPPSVTPGTSESELLQIGQAVEATLPAGERHFYAFQASGGLPVVIDLVALEVGPTSLDPYLELYGPAGQFLYENDDVDYGMVNAHLSVTLPTTGVYTLVVHSFGDRTGGMYRLSLRVGSLWK
jgi:hypothetical protein